MRQSFLRALWVSGIVVAASACGGKVIVDGLGGEGGSGGAGGAGGATNTSTNTSVSTGTTVPSGTSVTTGTTTPTPECSCDKFCGNITACGGPNDECMTFCDQVPPDIFSCVCNVGADCQAIQQVCLGNGPGSTGAGGGSPDPSQACIDCTEKLLNGPQCQDAVNACFKSDACQQILQCHNDCGYGPECAFCDKGPPNAKKAFVNLLQCGVCGECLDACSPHPVTNYCGG